MIMGMCIGCSPYNAEQSVITQAIAVLRRFGTDAHVYLPGVGMLNGLQAANYIDSAGTTAATVDQPVGLVLDAAGSLGVELVTNGDFSNGAAGWRAGDAASALAVNSGVFRITNGDATGAYATQSSTVPVAGKTYNVTIQVVTKPSSNGARFIFGGYDSGNTLAAGTFTTYVTATSTGSLIISNGNVGVNGEFGEYDNISVREVTGIHASQTTTASKPILRSTGGKYSWQFDGSNDSLSLGGPAFQMADDHCVIAGGLSTLATGDRYFLDHGSSASVSPMVASLALSGTLAKVYWRDDANVMTLINGGFVAQGSVAILSARKVATTGVLRVNGQQVASAAIAAGATTLTGAAIGTRVSPANMLAGQVYPVIAIKGTVSDSDILLLEKWVGSMSGATIL